MIRNRTTTGAEVRLSEFLSPRRQKRTKRCTRHMLPRDNEFTRRRENFLRLRLPNWSSCSRRAICTARSRAVRGRNRRSANIISHNICQNLNKVQNCSSLKALFLLEDSLRTNQGSSKSYSRLSEGLKNWASNCQANAVMIIRQCRNSKVPRLQNKSHITSQCSSQTCLTRQGTTPSPP